MSTIINGGASISNGFDIEPTRKRSGLFASDWKIYENIYSLHLLPVPIVVEPVFFYRLWLPKFWPGAGTGPSHGSGNIFNNITSTGKWSKIILFFYKKTYNWIITVITEGKLWKYRADPHGSAFICPSGSGSSSAFKMRIHIQVEKINQNTLSF